MPGRFAHVVRYVAFAGLIGRTAVAMARPTLTMASSANADTIGKMIRDKGKRHEITIGKASFTAHRNPAFPCSTQFPYRTGHEQAGDEY